MWLADRLSEEERQKFEQGMLAARAASAETSEPLFVEPSDEGWAAYAAAAEGS